MNRYELVVLVDSRLSNEEIESNIKLVDEILWKNLIEKDDMWLLDLEYNMNWADRAYFVSYFIDSDDTTMSVLRKHFFLNKEKILRYVFYKMSPKDEFLKYKDLQKKFENIKTKKNKKMLQEYKEIEK